MPEPHQGEACLAPTQMRVGSLSVAGIGRASPLRKMRVGSLSVVGSGVPRPYAK